MTLLAAESAAASSFPLAALIAALAAFAVGLLNYFSQKRSLDLQLREQREQADEQRQALLGNERERQLRERSLIVAGDFAGGAMDVLAHLRHYRPTKYRDHRNEGLHEDAELLRERAKRVSLSLDQLRPMRGRVWMFFPGRSSMAELKDHGPQTTADWAEDVVARLQAMQNVCEEFWRHCQRQPEEREAQELAATEAFRTARTDAWRAVDQFAATAAKRVRGSAQGEQ